MNIYKQNIIDHNKNPKHYGEINDAHGTANAKNPLCGDEITVMIKVEKNKLSESSFIGKGCAVSQAAASIVLCELEGSSLEEVSQLTTNDILEMLGIELSPTRMKCAVLIKDGLEQAIQNYKSTIDN